MATIYYSRELSELQKAKDGLLAVGACQNVTPENVTTCAAAICDPLLKFTESWSAQHDIYESRRNASNPFRIVFGEHDPRSSNFFKNIGILPLIFGLLTLVGVGWLWKKFLNRKGIFIDEEAYKLLKVDKENDLQITILITCGLGAALVVVLGIFWTIGMVARHEAQGTENALHNDSGKNSGKIYNDATFGKIWQACNTKLLRKIYNCRHGLDQMTGIPKDPNIDDEVKETSTSTGKCNGFDPQLTLEDATERATLALGLNTLRGANIGAFDSVALLQVINEEINRLRSLMAPKGMNGAQLSAAEAQKIVLEQILPIMKQPAYKPLDPLDPQSRAAAATAFQEAMATEFVPKTATQILQYWPLLNPEMYMNVVDEAMESYYNARGNEFYAEHLQQHVLTTFRSAMGSVSQSLQGLDPRYATVVQFVSTNWRMVQLANKAVTASLQRLKDAVNAYVVTFASGSNRRSLSYELGAMYINHTIAIVVFATVAGFVYYLFVAKLDLFKSFRKADVSGVDKMHSGVDVAKYILIMVGFAMFVIAMLVAIRTKRDSAADHNANATQVNTMKLKASISVLADPDSMGDANRFYLRAISVLEAYERCNTISRSNRVPFPTVEFFAMIIFACVCAGCIAYITLSTGPRSRINEIRGLVRMRHKLKLFSSSVPPSLMSEIDSLVGCSITNEADLLKILAFVLVLILFILNGILVYSFNKSARDYRNALNTLAADVCV